MTPRVRRQTCQLGKSEFRNSCLSCSVIRFPVWTVVTTRSQVPTSLLSVATAAPCSGDSIQAGRSNGTTNPHRRCLCFYREISATCASPHQKSEGISCGRDCEEVSVRRLDSVSKSSRARAEQHANSDRRLETYLDRTEACPICNWRDRSIADLDGMRLERNGRSAVAIASPLATYGPVPTHDDLARLRTRIDDAQFGPI